MTHEETSYVSGQSDGVTSTSRSLIMRVKENDDDAWERLAKLYTPLIYHWCQRLGLQHHDIPDIVQDVFKSVSENIDRFRKEKSKDTFRGWLRVITRNKVTDHFRRQGKQVDGAGGTEALRRLASVPDIEDSVDEAEELDDDQSNDILFQQALSLIRQDFHEKTWKAFWRVVVDDCLAKDVAEELQMTPGAVRVAKSRVLQRLREELAD